MTTTSVPVRPAATREDAAALADVLFETWVRVDPDSTVALYPASYRENFLDMARAALDSGKL